MEDCGGVSIKFPSADSKSDKVTIRGPKDDVDRAKQQLLDLANERQLASYTAEVKWFYRYVMNFWKIRKSVYSFIKQCFRYALNHNTINFLLAKMELILKRFVIPRVLE